MDAEGHDFYRSLSGEGFKECVVVVREGEHFNFIKKGERMGELLRTFWNVFKAPLTPPTQNNHRRNPNYLRKERRYEALRSERRQRRTK